MNKKRGWITALVAVAVATILFFTLFAGQTPPKTEVTLENLYTLLVNEDGQNRLDQIENSIEVLQGKIDAIQTCINQMKSTIEEQEWEKWDREQLLRDMKFRLDDISNKLNTLLENSGPS